MINLPSFFYKLENSKKHEVSGYIENEKEKKHNDRRFGD